MKDAAETRNGAAESLAATDPAEITALGQIAINVEDVARAEAFYRDVLGLEHLFTFPGLTFFRCGEVRLMLSRPEKPELDHPASILYLRVGDLPAAVARLRERGLSFEEEPHVVHRDARHELWMAFFRDSEANLMALMSEVPAG